MGFHEEKLLIEGQIYTQSETDEEEKRETEEGRSREGEMRESDI